MAVRTNVMTDRSLSCRTLAMVASALSRVFGVEVATSGTEAYTLPPGPGHEHYRINVPSMDVDDAKYLTLIRGYIDHEVGHVRFTDMDEVQSVRHKDSSLARWNILEDPYVEYKMGLCYMGCERNLRDLARAVFSLEELEEIFGQATPSISHLAGMFHNYLLFYAREMVDPDHFKPLREYMEDVCKQAGGGPTLEEMHRILQKHDYHPCRTNTGKNVKIAMELYRLLNKAAANSTACSGPAPDDTALPEDVADSLRDADTRSRVEQQMLLNNKTCNAPMTQTNPNASEFDVSRRAAKAISAETDDMAKTGRVPMPDTDFEAAGNQAHTGRLIGQISEYDKKQAMNIRAVLDLRLRSLLQSYVMARGGSAACGKLDTHKLHRLAVNNPRVFQHRVEKRGVNTEVLVLVDVSGSMSGQKADMTTQALYALMTSLSRIKGVRAGAFGFNADSFPCYVPMGGAVTNQMRICPSGGTLLGEGINSCLSRFNYDEGSRQVLIILSDGDSQNHNYVRYMLKKTKDVGVEVAAVGIMDNYIMQYKDVADCRVIKDLKELPSTLFNILQDKLVVGGLR